MIEIEDSEEYNDEVDQWTKDLIEDFKRELDTLDVRRWAFSPNKTPLRKAIKAKLYKRYGIVNKVGISMPKSAVFLHKGVSKGHPISNPRRAKAWFNPVVDRNIGKLTEIAAKHSVNFIVNSIYIK